MDTAPWPQEIVVKPMEEMIGGVNTCSSSVTTTPSPNIFSNNTNNNNNNNNNNINGKVSSTSLERKVRPEKDQALNCPRCNSTNTKFCYYNNYSLTQPRYFCKTCRRYWTEGGSLRNIPVGGGSRKNKRSSSSNSSSSNTSPPSSKKFLSHDPHLLTPPNTNHNTNIHPHQGQDLNLGFPPTHQDQFRSLSEFIQLPNLETNPAGNNTQVHDSASVDPSSGVNAAASSNMSALELLNGLASSRGLTPFMPMPVPDPNGVYSSGLMSLHDFKPTLNFSLDGLGNGYGSLSSGVQQQETAVNNGRLLFPFEDCNNKTVSNNTASTDHDHENANTNTNTAANDQTRDHGDSTGYWTGMLGTSGSW